MFEKQTLYTRIDWCLLIEVYLDRVKNGHTSWPVRPLVDGVPDIENVTEALQKGPYGKCVYESDNDVVDHQVSAQSSVKYNKIPLVSTLQSIITRLD